jgi:hypothetical protein
MSEECSGLPSPTFTVMENVNASGNSAYQIFITPYIKAFGDAISVGFSRDVQFAREKIKSDTAF